MHQFHTPAGAHPDKPEEFPEDAPFDSGPLDAAKSKAINALLFMLALCLFIAGYFIWLYWQSGRVESSRPVGHLIGMSGPGGRAWPLVIETEQGFFPLGKAVAIPKGTPLMIEDRASGDRFICDLKRTVCVRTSVSSMPAPASPIQQGAAR